MIKFKVYEMMAKRGYATRKALAKAAGVHETNIGKIVRGDIACIDTKTLDALCYALDCQPGDLIEHVKTS